MSEKATPSGHEKAPKLEAHEAREQLDKIAEQLNKKAEKETSKERSGEKLEAKHSAEKEAVSGKEMAPTGSEKKSAHEPVHRNFKKQTYKATMRRVEAKLPAYQRSFSRIINNNTVDKVSNVASKTVARPSGILGAGLFAFLALIVVTYFANRYGFTTSGSEFIVFVGVGFMAGLVAEGVVKLVRRR